MANRIMKFLIAAGGTGGHLFPAIAVAEQISEKLDNKAEFHFVGNADKIEGRIVPQMGYKFHEINISGLKKKISFDTVMLPFKIISSINTCREIILKEGIDAVICAGAYLSYPAGIAASMTKIPLVLMESNVNPGKAIKMLSKRADFICTAFDESKSFFDASLHSKMYPLGNPVRKAILNKPDKQKARSVWNIENDNPLVLIFGGSLGARSINLAMEKELSKLAELNINFIWQTGKNYTPPTNVPKNIIVTTFIDDMANAYAASDFVIARSGATTVAELCVMAKPSALVPLPSASNNEQYHNAKVLEQKNASILIDNSQVSDKLFDVINSIVNDQAKLTAMSNSAANLAKPMAASDCADKIIKLLKN